MLEHFLACNNEDGRSVTSSGLRPRVLQEYDLAAFRPADATRAAGDAVIPAGSGRPATLLFRSADLSGVTRFAAEVAREDSGPGGAVPEVRAVDRLIAATAVPVTGGRHTRTTVTTGTGSPLDGVHDLRLTPHGDFRLASFRFDSPKVHTT